MKTVRLGDQLETQLDKVSQSTGKNVSEIVREAVRRHCKMLSSDQLCDQLSDVIGAVSSGQGQSRETGRQFAKLVRRKHSNRKKKPSPKGQSK